MPKNGTVSQVLSQLVVACTSPKFISPLPPLSLHTDFAPTACSHTTDQCTSLLTQTNSESWKSNPVLGSEDQFKPCRCILQWRASGNHEGGGSEFTFMHQSIPPTPKCPTPGTDKVGKCPVVAQGGAGCRGN